MLFVLKSPKMDLSMLIWSFLFNLSPAPHHLSPFLLCSVFLFISVFLFRNPGFPQMPPDCCSTPCAIGGRWETLCVCVCEGLIGWQASVWVGRCSSARSLILILADGVLCSVLLEEHSLPAQERICLAACFLACCVCVCVTEWVCAQMSMHVCMYMCAHMCACVWENVYARVCACVCVCLFCCFAYRPSSPGVPRTPHNIKLSSPKCHCAVVEKCWFSIFLKLHNC